MSKKFIHFFNETFVNMLIFHLRPHLLQLDIFKNIQLFGISKVTNPQPIIEKDFHIILKLKNMINKYTDSDNFFEESWFYIPQITRNIPWYYRVRKRSDNQIKSDILGKFGKKSDIFTEPVLMLMILKTCCINQSYYCIY